MVLKGLLGYMPVNVAQALVGFGAVAAFTRLLSPADYGLYALILSASMLAHTLAFSWVEAAAFRFLPAARARGEAATHFATLAGLAIVATLSAGILTLVAFGLVFLVSPHLWDDRLVWACALAALATLARFATRLGRESDRADQAVARYAAWEGITLLLGFAAGVVALIAFDLGPAGPFLGLLIGALPAASVDIARWTKAAHGGAPTAAQARLYAGFGAPLAAALALDLLVQTAARFVIAGIEGEAAAGAYSAAYALSARMIDLVFVWAGLACAPMSLAAFEAHGPQAAYTLMRRVGVTLVALAAPATLGLVLVARPFAAVMVGEGLRDATAALAPWLALAGLATGLTTHFYAEAFQLTRRTGLRALLMLAPAIATIGLTLVFTPIFGVQGAAMAAALSAMLGMTLVAVVGRRLLPLDLPLKDLARIAAACAAMAAAVLALPDLGGLAELTLKAAVGALAYGAAIVALDLFGLRAAVWQRVGATLAMFTARPSSVGPK